MDIWVCDCCGKQTDRFVKSNRYEIRKSCRDRKDRAFYMRTLNLCVKCQIRIEKMLDNELERMPEKVEVELYRDE